MEVNKTYICPEDCISFLGEDGCKRNDTPATAIYEKEGDFPLCPCYQRNMAKNWQEIVMSPEEVESGWDINDLLMEQVKRAWEARQPEVDEAYQIGYQKAVEKMSFILPAKFKKAEQRGIRKVTEWGDEPCPHSNHYTPKRICRMCWQAFLKGVEK